MVQSDTKDNDTLQLDKKGKETLVAILSTKSMTDAAKVLSLDRTALYKRIDKYKLRTIIDKIPEQALDNLKAASVAASNVFVGALDERVNKMQAAKEILDRVGVVAPQPHTLQQFNVQGELKLNLLDDHGREITQGASGDSKRQS